MTNKAQTVGGVMRAVGDAAAPSSKGGSDPTDVSHLRPLSEGVLKAAGFHGGLDADGKVRDLRGLIDGAFDLDPNDLPSDELHVQLMRLQEKFGGLVSRDVLADGSIVLKFVYGDGDTTTSKAADTPTAARQLIEKMGRKD